MAKILSAESGSSISSNATHEWTFQLLLVNSNNVVLELNLAINRVGRNHACEYMYLPLGLPNWHVQIDFWQVTKGSYLMANQRRMK